MSTFCWCRARPRLRLTNRTSSGNVTIARALITIAIITIANGHERLCGRRGIVGGVGLWKNRESAIAGEIFDERISAILSPVTGDIIRLHFSPLTSHAAKYARAVSPIVRAWLSRSLSVRKETRSSVPPFQTVSRSPLPGRVRFAS